MTDVQIPKMGMSTVEVDVLRVLVSVGQQVEPGDLLVEIESEKATFEVEAAAAGVVTEILVSEGETYAVGDVLLRIEDGS